MDQNLRLPGRSGSLRKHTHVKIDLKLLVLLLFGLTISFHALAQVTGWSATTVWPVVSDGLFIPMDLLMSGFAWLAGTREPAGQRSRWGWYVIGIAALLAATGDGLWLLYDLRGETPFPSIADLVYLLFYPTILVGLLLFPRQHGRMQSSLTFWLDVGAVGTGGWMVAWHLVLRPTMLAPANSGLEMALAVAYPVGSLVLLFGGAVVSLGRPDNLSRRSLYFLIGYLFANFCADIAFGYMTLQNTYQSGRWVDTIYLVAIYLLACSGYAQLSAPSASVREAPQETQPARAISLLPYLAIVLGYGTLLIVAYDGWETPTGGLILGAIVLSIFIVARQIAAVRHNLRLIVESATRDREARAIAEAANRAKSAFLASMSHELRTPLTAIHGYTELLQLEVDAGKYNNLTSDILMIKAASQHLLMLINEILDFSKIEAGRMQFDRETFDVAALIEEACHTARPLVERNRNRFQVLCAAELGTMSTDRTKLKQVLLNLLSNAAKFTEDGLVTLQASRRPDGSIKETNGWGERNVLPMLEFQVSDTGIGMTPEQMDQLFQPFVQVAVSVTRLYGGTGLGLALSYRYCEMMGGTIVVRSVSGQGSTFTVTLPALATTRAPEG
jgi:signal transduction histidine kinase